MTNHIFIGGCGHSGTTLLLKILGLHSQVIHYYENIENEENSRKIFDKKNEECIKIMTRAENTKTILFKNPSNILYIDEIRKYYKGSKIILMYRDGRDVALSYHRRKSFKSFKECVIYWKDRSELILSYGNDEDIFLLKYEDLIDKKEERIREILHFLKLKNEDLLEKYNDNLLPDELEKPKKEINKIEHRELRNWQINQSLYNSSRWEKDLTWWKKKVFYKIAGNMLTAMGYKIKPVR